MSRNQLLEELQKEHLKSEVPFFEVGDTVKVDIRIVEGAKERTQTFTGTVIGRKGCGIGETFTVYRVAYGRSMERIFHVHSPRISNIEVTRKGKTRRSKLYFIRGKMGKKAKIKERIVKKASK
ncbi:MAG: 50S ribosomal protein L19 [Simkaniaceae bacterium]